MSERLRTKAEGDALRAEAGRLREALGRADGAFQAIDTWLYEENPPGGAIVGAQIREWKKAWVDLSAPLSAVLVERWKAMERVVEAATYVCDLHAGYEGSPTDFAGGNRLREALAARDRTEEK